MVTPESLKADLPSMTDAKLVEIITAVSEEVAGRMMLCSHDPYVVSKIRIAESFPADMENGLDETKLLEPMIIHRANAEK